MLRVYVLMKLDIVNVCGVGGGNVSVCLWCGFVIFYFLFFILSRELWQIKVSVGI